MSLIELRVLLGRLGIEVSARGDRLHWRAPSGVMTPVVKAALADHKAALLAAPARTEERTEPVAQPDRDPARRPGPADEYDREERAAIMEFEGGLSREAAECAAGLRSRGGGP
jgi:hypothetical protein